MEGAVISRQRIYVGTYTRQQSPAAQAGGAGLYVLEFDSSTGSLETSGRIAGLENQAFLTVAPDGRSLRTVWEVPEWPEGIISSYAIASDGGDLSYVGLQGSKGVGPCYTTTDSQGRCCFVSNYGSGHVAMFPMRKDGSLGEGTSVAKQSGHGPDPNASRAPTRTAWLSHPMTVSPSPPTSEPMASSDTRSTMTTDD